jgi:hypothetical protein
VLIAERLHRVGPRGIRIQNPNRVLCLHNVRALSRDNGAPILASVRIGAAQNRIFRGYCSASCRGVAIISTATGNGKACGRCTSARSRYDLPCAQGMQLCAGGELHRLDGSQMSIISILRAIHPVGDTKLDEVKAEPAPLRRFALSSSTITIWRSKVRTHYALRPNSDFPVS